MDSQVSILDSRAGCQAKVRCRRYGLGFRVFGKHVCLEPRPGNSKETELSHNESLDPCAMFVSVEQDNFMELLNPKP